MKLSTYMVKSKLICGFISIMFISIAVCHCQPVAAKEVQTKNAVRISNEKTIHPMNKKLVQMGLMKTPGYFPNVPRITAQTAFSLYQQNKALFVLNSHEDLHLIVGGLWKEPQKFDMNKVVKENQILVYYCP